MLYSSEFKIVDRDKYEKNKEISCCEKFLPQIKEWFDGDTMVEDKPGTYPRRLF